MRQDTLIKWIDGMYEAGYSGTEPILLVHEQFLDGLLSIEEYASFIEGYYNLPFLMTKEEAQKAQGLRYALLKATSEKFRKYCETEDCACGLSWAWRLPKDDVFQPACALHDFWDLNWRVAKEINLTIEVIDSWFNRELQDIVTRMSYWQRLYYVPRARVFYWLVRKFRPMRWG